MIHNKKVAVVIPARAGSMKLMLGDNLEVLQSFEENSIDAVVTDPPYGLKFMGKKWDYTVPSVELWQECLRVLKPGGYLLSFAGTRTYHRMVVNIEDAGFEIRDMIAWVYGSGFPKSHDIGKGIDKAAGVEREVVGQREDILKKQAADIRRGKRKVLDSYVAGAPERNSGFITVSADITAPATPEAKQWDGWGTALKPAHEPIVVARKPFKGTVAANVLEYGTGGLNIDGCRIETSGEQLGRFPANLIHDGSEEVLELFPQSKSCNSPSKAKPKSIYRPGQGNYQPQGPIYPGERGSAARFFYCAKTSKKDRGAGNTHPTVKPTDLMRYLCRLVTQPGGVVLDPFMGSGSTGKAALLEGFDFIGIEVNTEYFKMAGRRVQCD